MLKDRTVAAADTPENPARASSTGPRDGERSRELWLATVTIVWPFTKRSYPGRNKLVGATLGYKPLTTARWGSRGAPVSSVAALKIAAYLEARIDVLTGLLRQWRAYAEQQARIEAQTHPGYRFRSFRASERSTWSTKIRSPTKKPRG